MEWDQSSLQLESSEVDVAYEGGLEHCSHSMDCERLTIKQEYTICQNMPLYTHFIVLILLVGALHLTGNGG